MGEGRFVGGSDGYGVSVDAKDYVVDGPVGWGKYCGAYGYLVEFIKYGGFFDVCGVAKEGKRVGWSYIYLNVAVGIEVGIGEVLAVGFYNGWGVLWAVGVYLIIDVH